jgi:hypothetical protein
MSNSKENTSTVKEERQQNHHKMITGMLMTLEAFLSSASDQVSDSLSLHDIGEETEIIKSLKEFIDSPVGNISKVNDSILKSIRNIQVQFLSSFVRKNKQYLKFAAYSHDDAATHIFIGLKSDNEETRDIFYELLDSYEKHEISKIYPLIFHFIPQDMLKLVINPNMIELDEQAHKSLQA